MIGLTRCVLLVVSTLLIVAGVSAQTWNNVRLNQDATTELQNEQQIAINPLDPDNMVTVWRDFRLGFRQVGWAYTFDGGLTWTEGGLIPEPNYPWQSDPGITVDENGTFYAIVLSLVSTSQANGLFILKSTDGGVSWGPPIAVVDGVPAVFEDKEFIACDRTDSEHTGNLYVAWTRFPSADNAQIIFRRSTDAGESWSGDIPISGTGAPLVQFPIPVVGRGGEVYVAWNRENVFANIKVKVSTDGGATFSPSGNISDVNATFFSLNGGVDAYSMPAMDADITDGPWSGRVYCAFTDMREGLGDHDVWLTTSDDQGATWSTPVRVNDDVPDNGRDQFHPWLFVDNLGIVSIVFLDRRDDPSNLEYHCYLAQSRDGGVTWSPNLQVSTVPSNPLFARPQRERDEAVLGDGGLPGRAGLIGEYIGVVAWNGRPVTIWTDIRNGNQDTFAGALTAGTGITESIAAAGASLLVAPNPLRPGQMAAIRAETAGTGLLRIYDLSGRLVRELSAGTREGRHDWRWDGRGADGRRAAAGVYFLRVQSPEGLAAKVVVLE